MAHDEKARILVADDEDSIASLLQALLEDLKYEVQTVYNGRDALEALASHPPDLVISDVMMPHTSGVDVLRAMRQRACTRDIPVILMSAAAAPGLPDEKVRFIHKPFDVQFVLDVVADTLKASGQSAGGGGGHGSAAWSLSRDLGTRALSA